MIRKGKCSNYAGCLVAYRNEEISVETGDFVCPECKQPLTPISSPAKKRFKLVPLLVTAGVLLVALLAWSFWTQIRRVGDGVTKTDEPAVVTGPVEPAEPPDNAPPPIDIAAPDRTSSVPVAVPVDPTGAPPRVERALPVTAADRNANQVKGPRLNLDLRSDENKRVKADVLKRIDLMPTVTAKNKDSLYLSVERARRMGRVASISFGSGRAAIASPEVETLKREVQSEQIQQLLQDPTVVFVVLGYADTKGDEKTNLEISERRAKSVLEALRDRCGVVNIMHAVGMGGSALFDEQSLEKNRLVEVWAVLP